VIVAEIYPWYVRSQCLTLNSFACYMLSFVVSFSWPTMLKSMHAQGAYSFFAGFTLLSTCFIYLFVPETKGVEMEAIQELFQYPLYTIAKKNVSETKAYMSKVSWFRRWVGGNGGESMRGHLKKTERNQCKMITKRVLVSMNKKK